MKSLLSKKDHQRRYYLHSKVKNLYPMDSHRRQVNVPASETEEAMNNKFIKELCSRFGYNIQSSIM